MNACLRSTWELQLCGHLTCTGHGSIYGFAALRLARFALRTHPEKVIEVMECACNAMCYIQLALFEMLR